MSAAHSYWREAVKCEVCGLCFAYCRGLDSIHTGEKPFKCDWCGLCFSDNSNLKRHLNTHTGYVTCVDYA